MALSNTGERVQHLLSLPVVADSRMMDIIEFGRMIHAEMSALTRTDLTNIADRLGRVENRRPITSGGTTGLGTANGVMISPCYMLTNYHVVFGDETNPRPQGDYSVYFYIGRGPKDFKYRLDGRPIHWGHKTGDGGQDYAIVQIPKCPGKVLGWVAPKPVKHPDLIGRDISMAAIPATSDDGKIAISHCTALSREVVSNLLEVTCAFGHGYSGGALMIADRTHGYVLIGLDQSFTDEGAYRAITMNEILADPYVTGLLATDLQAFEEERKAQGPH